FVAGNAEFARHHAGIFHPRGLRTAVDAAHAGGGDNVLQEHSVIDPTALRETTVDGEDEAGGRAEEFKIPSLLRPHLAFVAALNAKQAVESPTHLATTGRIGLEEL